MALSWGTAMFWGPVCWRRWGSWAGKDDGSACRAQVGVIHTSYRELSRRNSGKIMEGVSTVFNALLCAIHCHKARTQPAPFSPTCQ